MCSRLRARFVKYGCQPRPAGCAISAVLANTISTCTDCGVSVKYWVASNANGQSASPACFSRSTSSSTLLETISQGRRQPTPCSECGLVSKLGWVV